MSYANLVEEDAFLVLMSIRSLQLGGIFSTDVLVSQLQELGSERGWLGPGIVCQMSAQSPGSCVSPINLSMSSLIKRVSGTDLQSRAW